MSAQDLTIDQSKAKQSKFNQKFKQQRLPAWQPILTADTVLPAFFLIGLLFVPLGAALLFFSRSVQEMQLDYTDCKSVSHMEDGLQVPCSEVIRKSNFTLECTCHVNFTITEPFGKSVYLYYGLDNFYQNHRRYVKSRDDNQLLGKVITTPSNDCNPFGTNGDGKIYAPCGAIANSMFNDSLTLYDAGKDEQLNLIKTGIAWPSDSKLKFNNPSGKLDGTDAFKNTVKPPYWTKNVWQLSDVPGNNGYENEDLIVWMRSAAFPTFRKLYGKIDHNMSGFKFSFPKGRYYLKVQYRYPVDSFGGRKRMILSTTSFLGGKNNFLGIAYITVGCICLLLGIIFLIIHIKFGRRAVDQLNINQNTPYND